MTLATHHKSARSLRWPFTECQLPAFFPLNQSEWSRIHKAVIHQQLVDILGQIEVVTPCRTPKKLWKWHMIRHCQLINLPPCADHVPTAYRPFVSLRWLKVIEGRRRRHGDSLIISIRRPSWWNDLLLSWNHISSKVYKLFNQKWNIMQATL